ncbi:MAG: glutamate-5-semialdehyde dehydrogenase [Planctomycetota bacterium]|nr:glutamate-5-semialdehyde dehydrogenase [Planctomycetota bacterium]MDA1212809.1 glutamate-5-semialdehyde dehydrogenase [Planctomycetota bacterium]
MVDLVKYTHSLALQAREASRQLVIATGEQKSRWLQLAADGIRRCSAEIIAANAQDLKAAPGYGLNTAAIDRLRLNESRLDAIAAALDDVIALPEPIGEVIDSNVRPNGLLVTRVRVPLGVVFFIYESRPNVTVDAAALCVKSGNAVILRGGKEALHSNLAFYQVLKNALIDAKLPEHAVQLVETTDREAVSHFLKLSQYIDVTIPRGGKSLIERVTAEASMPVIKHFDGVCHVYVDSSADLEQATAILINGKCQRPGVCNATETVLIHADVANSFLSHAVPLLKEKKVELRCCERSHDLVPGSLQATEADFRTEYLDLILSVKIVDSLDEAIGHITEFGSGHTDAIVTRDLASAERFTTRVDSAAVIVNASTRFNDGGEFGLGAEIGISTDKFHARGPCGLKELTSYKYVVHGQGQIRR